MRSKNKRRKDWDFWKTPEFIKLVEESIPFHTLMGRDHRMQGSIRRRKKYFNRHSFAYDASRIDYTVGNTYFEKEIAGHLIRIFTVTLEHRDDSPWFWWGADHKQNIMYELTKNNRWKLIKSSEPRHSTYLGIMYFLDW